MRRNVVLGTGFAAVIVAGAAGWVGGRQIKSPADVAARTAPPAPSVIVAPVEKRALASEVVVRGTVRYGAPQGVSLATSGLKKASDIITTAPAKGATLGEGDVAMATSGRPVFVLRGDKPSYRDIGPGASGNDVLQLEQALARIGLDPGAVDGTYDGATATAVAALYARSGWAPFGPTDEQNQAVKAAQTDDYSANADVLSQRETLASARGALATAQERVRRAERASAAAAATDAAATTKAEHDRLVAVADIAARSAALDAALDAETVAKLAVDEAIAGVPTVPTRVELAKLQATARQATRVVATARAELAAAQSGLKAVVVPVADATAADAATELTAAQAEQTRTQAAITLAETKLDLAQRRASSGTLEQVAAKLGIQVPADEIVFFPNVPLRVDTVKLAAGDALNGPFMTVTNSRLAIDGALSLDDTRLVKAGAVVRIVNTDLGLTLAGTVGTVAGSAGTDGVDPQRFHFEVTPNEAPTSLVGASVVMNITVNSTKGEVLSVPVAALSVAADGTSRVQVQAKDRSTTFVTVTPGLTASGFVAVTPTSGQLNPGDLVVVGSDTTTAAASTALGSTGSTTGTARSILPTVGTTPATTAKGTTP